MFQTFDIAGGPQHVAARVTALRQWMAKSKLDAVLVPRADAHQGEYVPAAAERLAWLTGFTGSAGLAVVARKFAVLMVDGRYPVQAATETDTDIFDISLEPRAKLADLLIDRLPKGAVVGFDPWLHTTSEIRRLSDTLKAKGLKLKAMRSNPIDKLWGKARPAPPNGAVVVQPVRLAGTTADEKVSTIQTALKTAGHGAVVLTLPDSICWLLNMRGSDVAHNPVALCFAILPASGRVELFIDAAKLDKQTKAHLSTNAKVLRPAQFSERLSALKGGKRKVRVDPNTAAHAIRLALGDKTAVDGADPCILPKAIKTAAEIAGSQSAQLRDGAAMVKFLAWLDACAPGDGIDEISAVRKLEQHRAETGELRDISFATIAGSGPNGAIVHYRVNEATNRALQSGELFLIDSGGQYQDGTTDITRTVAIGPPTDDMRRMYTAVLKGHIAVATARFPKGTRGIDLDPFARRPLWDCGADFDHGTGHGIGSYLSVHEGPQSISRAGMAELKPGMLLSNEPGYYRKGAYGIRLENVVLVTEAETRTSEDRAMMRFETLTRVPFDRRLIDVDALDVRERDWLDAYHHTVWNDLNGLVDDEAGDWLKTATEKL